jgi:DNA repair exonuclease SbcCD ATPase subunit
MKRIKYKKLSVQNFLSIGNDTIEVDFQKGLNLITGQNIDNPDRKNAVGKSALMSAYFFGLFGETIGKIKNEFVVNNITKGKGRIELEFDVEIPSGTQSYKIVRQIKPSKVELWKGTEDITRDSITNTNKYICDLLGTNPVIHKSCDIMTLSETTPFMLKAAADKRKFIEDIFGIEIFGLMLKDLKKQISENKSEMNVSSAVLDELNTSITAYTDQLNQIKKQIEERDAILASRKCELEEKLSSARTKLEEMAPEANSANLSDQIKKLDDAWTTIDGKIAGYLTKITENKKDLSYANLELSKFDSVDGVKCDKCMQNISHDHIEFIEEQKKQCLLKVQSIENASILLKSEKSKWDLKKTVVQNNIQLINLQIKNQQEIARKKEVLNQTISDYEQVLLNFDKDNSGVTISPETFEQNISKVEDRKKIQTENFNERKLKDSDYEVCKFVLGEEGVKSFVIKKLLDMLNQTIKHYINQLGMNITCKFDEYFDEEISTGGGKKFSYSNLSGAEKRSVDVACVLSFSDMRRKISGISSNLEFYDEIFDSAFDERGLDLLIEVLKSRIEKNNTCVYAISHRKETIKHIDGEVINLEKENNITRRIK